MQHNGCAQLVSGNAISLRLLTLGLALYLLIISSGHVLAALPSRVLQLRDTQEQVAIGLGEMLGKIRISSTSGVRLITSRGENVEQVHQAIRVVGHAGEQPRGQGQVWRVQIKASRDEEAAQDLRRQVEKDCSFPAYVVQVEPWYKVQVGDAASPAEAEALKERLMLLGYQDSWVTRVALPPEEAISDSTAERPYFRIEDDAGHLLTTVKETELMAEAVGPEPLTLEISGIKMGSYRGHLRLEFLGEGRVGITNIIGLEEYLYGVVGSELYSRNEEDLAALAAQAVAARTYAIENLGKHDMEGFDLCSTVHCQVYQGTERESELIRKAVDLTEGEILVYGGQTISAVYHSSSGGATAGAEQVWATRYSGYLRPQLDEAVDPETGSLVKLGENRPGYNWEIEWQGDELADSLRRYLQSELSIKVPSTAVLNNLQVVKGDALDRVDKLVIRYEETTEAGESRQLEYEVKKDKIRWVLRRPDGGILPSTCFSLDIDQQNGRVRKAVAFGRGNGHGLGLSQAGALHMSRLGYAYEDILAHYYTGVALVSVGEYYERMESRLIWEDKGLVQTWAAILGPDQGIDELTDVIKWSPSGDLIAYGTSRDQGGLWVFNTITGESVCYLREPIREVAWKTDGSALAVVSQNGQGELRQLRIVELGTSNAQGDESAPTYVLGQAVDIHSPAWLPDSELVVFAQNGMIYGAQDGVSVPLIADAGSPCLSPDGKKLALSKQGAIWLYQLATGAAERLCWIGNIQSLIWSPDGEYLAATTDSDIAVINVFDKEIVARFPGDSPTWSADGWFLAYVHADQGGGMEARIWELNSSETQVLAESKFGSEGQGAIHWSASGNSLAYNIDRMLYLLTFR
ncbi:MAG: SpoIID/LytB domain-containing protein [Firmicutes bacterium]|nr:SpoIID/LytB domain-containing protein [Bacillota bacterium]